jgi:hypothetical protein
MYVRRGTAPHLFEVESDSEADKWYQVFANGTEIKCTCKAYQTSKKPKTCKHVGAVQEFLQDTEGGREPEEAPGIDAGQMVVPPPSTPPLSKWVKRIHGREFIEYQGLLAMAHEHGLQELAAEFISVNPELALATAHAFFADGRKFWDAGDATPNNVHSQVKAHFPRVALTRAKARVLRDALNIGMVAVEELNED